MPWVKLDDSAPDHPKQIAAGAQACWLWVCGLAYCNRQKRKDGFIPAAKVPQLYPMTGALRYADKLVDVGLWVRVDGGFTVYAYDEYQLTTDVSGARAEAGRKGGLASGHARRSKREASDEANASTQSEAKGWDGMGSESALEGESVREGFVPDFEAFYAPYPKKIGRTKGERKFRREITTQAKYDSICKARDNYIAHVSSKEYDYIRQFDTFMNTWEEWLTYQPPLSIATEQKHSNFDSPSKVKQTGVLKF